MVKHLPTMQETQVQSLGGQDPLEKEMATHSSTLAWKIPWTEEPGRLQSWDRKELDTTERLHTHTYLDKELTLKVLEHLKELYRLRERIMKIYSTQQSKP